MKERCEASGYPVAKITWLQNGIQMSPCLKNISTGNSCAGQNYQVLEGTNEDYALSNSYLTIVSTKFPRDHGKYTCVARNSEGRDQKTMEVSIHSKCKYILHCLWYGVVNNCHLWQRLCAWIFVHGHYLLWEVNRFLRAKFKKNCEDQGTVNVQGQISMHI